MCTKHFVDGEPTPTNPHPTIDLDYPDATRKVKLISKNFSRRRKFDLEENSEPVAAKCPKKAETVNAERDEIPVPQEDCVLNEEVITEEQMTPNHEKQPNSNFAIILFYVRILFSFISFLLSTCTRLSKEVKTLKRENEMLKKKISRTEAKSQDVKKKCRCHQPLHKRLLNDKNIRFYTNLPSMELFNALHEYIAPFVKRRFKGASCVSTKLNNRFARSPKKIGPKRKLESKDEFLLTLMKLRLGVLVKDLASRFKICAALTSQIFHAWIRAMVECFNYVYVPDSDVIRQTAPSRFKHLRSTHSIIDCSEIFIETPKCHALQSVTWSDYKHHNTLKFLVAVSPNSNIVYVSEAYSGKISDKKLTIDYGYLDSTPQYMRVNADKGFNISDECAARHIFYQYHLVNEGPLSLCQRMLPRPARLQKCVFW